MYKFICANGHVSHSASKAQTDPACPHCRETAYRVVGAEEIRAQRINAHDCVRDVLADGVVYNLHARTALAYTNGELRRAGGLR